MIDGDHDKLFSSFAIIDSLRALQESRLTGSVQTTALLTHCMISSQMKPLECYLINSLIYFSNQEYCASCLIKTITFQLPELKQYRGKSPFKMFIVKNIGVLAGVAFMCVIAIYEDKLNIWNSSCHQTLWKKSTCVFDSTRNLRPQLLVIVGMQAFRTWWWLQLLWSDGSENSRLCKYDKGSVHNRQCGTPSTLRMCIIINNVYICTYTNQKQWTLLCLFFETNFVIMKAWCELGQVGIEMIRRQRTWRRYYKMNFLLFTLLVSWAGIAESKWEPREEPPWIRLVFPKQLLRKRCACTALVRKTVKNVLLMRYIDDCTPNMAILKALSPLSAFWLARLIFAASPLGGKRTLPYVVKSSLSAQRKA